MSTTSLIVEILVIGYTAFVWLFLFAELRFHTSLFDFLSKIGNYKNWAAFVVILSVVAAYQIGTLLDYFSYRFFYFGIRRSFKNKDKRWLNIGQRLKRARIPDGKFWERYNLVCQKGAPAVREELNLDHSIIRFTRSGFVNFFLIGTAILFTKEMPQRLLLSLICYGIAYACARASLHRWAHWYDKIATSYSYLKAQEKSWPLDAQI